MISKWYQKDTIDIQTPQKSHTKPPIFSHKPHKSTWNHIKTHYPHIKNHIIPRKNAVTLHTFPTIFPITSRSLLISHEDHTKIRLFHTCFTPIEYIFQILSTAYLPPITALPIPNTLIPGTPQQPSYTLTYTRYNTTIIYIHFPYTTLYTMHYTTPIYTY